ncbi:hypothetical protein [Flavobacterium sp. KMS]|jgi:hypothetical protein|uniref:hypothetical protein n=1 Tax=unclassified Flavobacterium TaxID=196869 RepID=UPI00057D1349|nr:hypothetical protein [Flavobacterium sp. KMS]KIA97078.1 hypothetical protein OA93_15960 [Flavobacterium sp. KMS]
MKKIVILICLSIQFSCTKQNELKTIFIAKENEYWQYKDDCQSHGVYFKFNKKGDYDKYNRFINGGFDLFNNDGDLISGPRSWGIKNDSTFVWDDEDYKIEKCNPKQIILSYYHYKEKNRKCKITLNKVLDK